MWAVIKKEFKSSTNFIILLEIIFSIEVFDEFEL